eukprot:CAMPEP_0118687678 /NCGR_PEP_ID=MMETSP0800-20121206/8513_1 /TAXON_ID=210618 ORGANISM="Striatella unipunctata, Strain CCMP2910" /NCGR_SAMPLE_ID=MMETSP0800 /ASSEMBLY_ACC=CAM_ASM_000638 /LENGTH=233 /DNA_ID=CAMNT_0006584883 /DNA_START=390 /DNA_END=1091 /DNA_ORIENTATION=-
MSFLSLILNSPFVKPFVIDTILSTANNFLGSENIQGSEFSLPGCTPSTINNIDFCDSITFSDTVSLLDVSFGLDSVTGLGSIEITELDYEVASSDASSTTLAVTVGLAVYNVTPTYSIDVAFPTVVPPDISLTLPNEVGTLTALAEGIIVADCSGANALTFALTTVTFSEPQFIDVDAVLEATGLGGLLGATLQPLVENINNVLSGDISGVLSDVILGLFDGVQLFSLPCFFA